MINWEKKNRVEIRKIDSEESYIFGDMKLKDYPPELVDIFH